jgi:photosystem II stability/assembly factor-like uncharacterized protein
MLALSAAPLPAGFIGWTYSVASDGLSSQISRTTNGGTNWSVQENASGHLQSLAFSDTLHGWAGINGSSSLLHTTDGGVSWTSVSTGVGTVGFLGISALDAQNVWAIGFGSALAHTSNGGATWSAQSPQPNGNGNFYSVQFLNSLDGWLVGDKAIQHSTDGGQTWNVQLSSTSFHGLFFDDLSNGWAIGANNALFHTSNGGAAWAFQSTGLTATANLEGIFFTSPNIGWLVTAGGQILHTTNGGANWATQFTGANALLGVSFVDSLNGWAVGLNSTVLHTADGGASWNPQSPGTVDPFIDAVVFPASAVPEPTSLLLMGLGIVIGGLTYVGRAHRRS